MEGGSIPKVKGEAVVYASGNLGSKSKPIKVDKNIDKYIEESKNYKINDYFKEGLYLDVKDDFNWCVAQIKEIYPDRNQMLIHFDNWSNKYDEELPFVAKKVYPIRFYSEKYTGQKRSTLRDYDVGLVKKESIMQRMEGYTKTLFKCETADDIQEMYQFLAGECYLYIDSLITCDEKDAKTDAASIVEFMTAFFEMLTEWMKLIPLYSEYYQYMQKYPYLYMVCPEAAVLNLAKSFIPSLELIFGLSPRSDEFLRTASYILGKNSALPDAKTKKLSMVQQYFMDAFVNTNCLSSLKDMMVSMEAGAPIDFTTILGLLHAISYTFIRIDHVSTEALDFIRTVNEFLHKEDAGINQKIKSLPQGQIKNLKESEIIAVVKDYYDISESTLSKEAFAVKYQLDLLLIFLQLPYIEKKISALNSITKLFDKKNKMVREVTSEQLSEWLANAGIIEYIYKEAKHPELISRSTELLSHLALNDRLSKDLIEMLWETCINEHKHEAVAEATLTVIAELAKILREEMLKAFIEQIENLPVSILGEYITTFKQFYYNCLQNFKSKYGKSSAEKKISKLVNLNIIWEAVQDESELSTKNKNAALDALIELMIAFDLSNTSEYLAKAIENLKHGISPLKCMTIIEKVLKTVARRGYPQVFKKEDLVMMAILSAEKYLTNARENSPMDGRNIEDMVFSGSVSHKDTIKRYFEFIGFLVKSFDTQNKLNSDHLDMMFKVFVKESISKIEREYFYKFFTYDEFNATNDDKKVATGKIREYLFNLLCKELSSDTCGLTEFNCFETNFFYVNTQKRNLKREMNEQVFRTVSMDLDGIDIVWDFSIFSKDESIRRRCNDFLVDLYLYNEKEDYVKRGKNNLAFFDAWLEKIRTIDQKEEKSIANVLRLLFNFVNRYDGHHMDTTRFEKYDVNLEVDMQDCPKDKPAKRNFRVNKEMTIGAIRKRIGDAYNIIPSEILILSSRSYLSETCMGDKLSAYKDCRNINVRRRTKEEKENELPRYLAASNLSVITQVVEKGLESKNHALRCEALQFFEYIPANNDRRDKMISCKKIAKGNDPDDWCSFLYCSDIKTQGIYYGLKVMKSIIVPFEINYSKADIDDFNKSKKSFYKSFNEYDGFSLLCSTLDSLDIEFLLKDVVWLSIFQLLVDILQTMLDDHYFISVVNKIKKDTVVAKSTEKLVTICSNILFIASSNVKLERDLKKCLLTTEDLDSLSIEEIQNITNEYENLETNFFYYLFSCLKNCLSTCQDEIPSFYKSNFIKNRALISLIATHPNKATVRKMNDGIVELCRTLRDNSKVKPTPAYFILELMTSQLENIITLTEVNYEFFELWDKLIRLLDPETIDKSVLDINGLTTLLYTTIVERPIIEDDVVLDPILAGSLLILDTLDEIFKPYIQETVPQIYSSQFLFFLMSKGLFSREKYDNDDPEITYPLCKHEKTRRHALQLVSQLFAKEDLQQVSDFLSPIIKNGSWRTNKREKWFISSSKLLQRDTHVGLVNLGCTCYMNSLMQQFFMSPYFRSFIFSAVDQKENELPPEDNVLYQSKYLFANLMKTKMPTYNPIVFFNSIKDYTGEPMPTNEQRDVDEFLNIYMDKIEQNIKGTNDDRYLKSIFGGSFAQELICIGCPHRSSREEQYLSVNVEIKNKTNILEGLDLFIQGEMLEGDNAYYCERCDKKVDTLKRCCIKKLPNCLVLSLKRFEFDLETLSRYKLNSYCEFYHDLDMREYCQETLAKKELQKKMKEENLTYELLSDDDKAIYDFNMPDIYYKYKLKGTVVHFGTADGGHYYSFIKDRNTDKWCEFNDVNVRDYDPENLPEDTFGGKLKHEQKVISGGRQMIQTEKLYSAYVLIYEREQFIDNDKLFEMKEMDDKIDLTRNLKDYTLPMRPISIDKSITDELIVSYDKHWISNKMFDQFFLSTITDMLIANCSYLHTDSERALKHAMDVDGDAEIPKLKFAFLFLFGVALRSEQRTVICQKLVPQIRASIRNSSTFANWVMSCLSKRHSIYEFFANCWSTEACRVICSIFKEALRKVYAEEKKDIAAIIKKAKTIYDSTPEDVPNYLIAMMNDPEKDIPSSLRCLYQFITVSVTHMVNGESISLAQFYFNYAFNAYASLDAEMRFVMIAFKIGYQCLNVSFGSQPQLDQLLPGVAFSDADLEEHKNLDDVGKLSQDHTFEFGDDDLGDFKSFKLGKFEKAYISNLAKDTEYYLFLFKIMSKLFRSCYILGEEEKDYKNSPYRMDNEEPLGMVKMPEIIDLVEPSENNMNILFSLKCANKVIRNEVALLYGHIFHGEERSIGFTKNIIVNLNHEEFKDIINYERILFILLTLEDKYMKERINCVLDICKKLMDNNINEYAYLDTFCGTIIKFAKKNKTFRTHLYSHDLVDKINKWLSSNPSPPLHSYRSHTTVFKNGKHNNKSSYDIVSSEATTIKEYNLSRKNELKIMYKKPDMEDKEPESEDDLYEAELEAGSKIDYIDPDTYKWVSGTVYASLGEIIFVHKDTDQMDVDGQVQQVQAMTLNKDAPNIAPHKSKSESLKARVLSVYTKAYEI